jgi:hypothetical protein
LPDTTTEIKAILARTLRELEQVIDNANITSFLRGLGSVLGLDGDSAPATKPISRPQVTAKPQRVTASRASTAGAARVPQARTTTAKARTRTPAKPASTPRASSSPSRARAGARRDQLLALVAAQPGITLAQGGDAVRSQERDQPVRRRSSPSRRRAHTQERRRAAPNRHGATEVTPLTRGCAASGADRRALV